MNKLKVGFVGWRGMVGSVLINRMQEEGDFSNIEPVFFSTSQKGMEAPKFSIEKTLWDAGDVDSLKKMDVILTCQGSDYTKEIYPKLKTENWSGYWIDASSALRMSEDAVLVLDPVNKNLLLDSLQKGAKTFVGSNCTVSLLLLALGDLIKTDFIEWISTMTYQAASGAGAQNMIELVNQMAFLGEKTKDLRTNKAVNILDLDQNISQALKSPSFPKDNFKVPLAGNIIPWIDTYAEEGQTKEEWKAMVEANKILGRSDGKHIPIDGTCVRVGAMRSHSQGVTLKLKKHLSLTEIEGLIKNSHEWMDFIPNEMEQTKNQLSPAAVSGTLKIAVGRLRFMKMGQDYINLFTVGDQLLWGAAEPLRRMLNILIFEKK